MSGDILKIEDLKVYYPVRKGMMGKTQYVKAVDGVSLNVHKGEVLGIVGESGCGKSTLGKAVCKLIPATDGNIVLNDMDIAKMSENQLRPLRKQIQMIFQDPYASLNPRMTVGEIIEEPMVIHNMGTPKERKAIVQDLIQTVGLKPDHIRRYPFELSGGQRQRIGIARALALNPEFIVCDEPISALDVSIQAQVINLLEKLQHERGFSYLFIAHDLEMVHHISHKIGVMYLGNMVEFGTSDEVYKTPLHPYTKALISASPVPDPELAKTKKRILLEGEVPSPLNPPKGCPFAPRCPHCTERCNQEKPETYSIGNHKVACFLYAPEK